MYFFDLHCDTVSECVKTGQNLYRNDLAVSVKKGAKIRRWAQTFAVFIHDKSEDPMKDFLTQDFFLGKELDRLSIPVFKGKGVSKFSALKSIENISFAGENLDFFYQLAQKGYMMASLTWNGANLYAGGAMEGGGLTPLGAEAVRELGKCGIIIDVSHLSDESFADVMKIHKGPVVASHSNARAVYMHKRSLTDDMLRQISERGGIVGVNFYTQFLSENPSIEDILRHTEHILKVCGEETPAIGSDFDGANMPDGLKSVENIEILYRLMVQYFGKATAKKVFFENALSFFENNAKTQ